MKPMNTSLHRFKIQAAEFTAVIIVAAALSVTRAQDIWTGAGSDTKWQTPGNWQSGNPPTAGDSLVFTGVSGLKNTNNFLAGTAFGSLSFKSSAGAFALNGNSITLNGNITNSQVVTEQAINLPVTLGTTPLVDVTPNGVLTFNGVFSGGGGLTTVDGGQLNLRAVNTFTGPVTVNAGTVVVSADSNLGAAPASATRGSTVLNGGTLRATNSFTLNANRGLAVGSAAGGVGTIKVDAGMTLTYTGIIAGNGGAGGLSKSSFGGLTLSGANTYTGPTIVKNGALTLNFAAAGAPANNIISSSSPLTVGGETAGVGQTNYAELLLTGNASATNSQAFSGTLIDVGGEYIQATSGAGGAANLALGALTHNVGGTVLFLPPASGSITTTATNNNGILGGWATIGSGANQNGAQLGTNFATVDASGNITNYNGYLNYSSGLLAGQVGPATNVLFSPTAAAQVITANNDNSGLTTDINSIKIYNPFTYSGIYIGPGNTLRLGKFGGILAQETAAAPVVTFGGNTSSVQSGNGNSGSQDIGILTAGGAPNTPGEIDLTVNNNNETSGSFIMECQITDNGTGPVSFVKTGPGPMKLDGHNTFSGGLYLLQGRLQLAGSEIGTGNPGGGGTGPIYVYPGAELFPSGTSTNPIVNNIFLSGNGVSDGVGAIRLSGVFSNGVITLIGDSRLGGGTATVPIYDQITGAFNLDIGATGNSGGSGFNNGCLLYNQSNNWSGNTTIVGRTGTAGNTLLRNGTNDVIPDGFGKGNLQFGNSGNTVSITAWDLNGFNETINGLVSIGTVQSLMYISNNTANATSILTVGNNDQSGTFSGSILGNIALTKIGAGIEILAGTNTYTGNTTVNAGTLALSGGGSISGSPKTLVQSGAILDVTAQTNSFGYPNSLSLSNGIFLVGSGEIVGTLNLTNGRVRLNTLGVTPNITATTLNTGGSTNLIDIISVGSVPSYPIQFTIIKYSGALNGSFNFGLGNVPSASTTGYISNNVANSSIDVVLLSGPKPLTWTGVNGSTWDISTTTNWLAFGTTPAIYNEIDSVTFSDSAGTGTVNLTANFNPGMVEVTNNSLNYIFTGVGGIGGFGGMNKDGTGALVLDNAGGNTFTGGFLINSGVVQMGNNDTGGSLPVAGGVQNNASLIFDRRDNVTIASTIIGSGSLTQNDTNVLTLSGNNAFTGPVTVSQGTLQAGSGTALGTADGSTTISSGATLDVNGQTLNTEPVIVSGAGVNGLGAIFNSGADDLTAMGNVTLAGNTTFGGTGRWDIRGGLAQLLTSGNAYNLTKLGTNQISLVGVNVDSGLGNINVLGGTLSIETTTSGLGNSGNTLTVASGATLQLYGATVSLNKQFVLNGNGVTTTLNCGNGLANNISGPITLNGSCISSAATGTAQTFSGSLTGGGSLLKVGAGTNIIANGAVASHTGGTVVSNGLLLVNGSLSGAVTVGGSTATLGGKGAASGAVTLQGGILSPGDVTVGSPGTFTVGSLAMNAGMAIFHLSSSSASGNDQVSVSGGMTFSGVNTLQIAPIAFMNVGDVYTLFTYIGATLPSSVTNNLQVAAPAGFAFSIVNPATTPGSIQIHVDQAIGNELWTGHSSSTWNTTAINWNRNGNSVAFNNGDYVNFDDTSAITNVVLSGALQVGSVTMNNSSEAYHFGGSGSLTGSGGLSLTSGGALTIANSGTNSFTGPITISSGTLQLGDGGNNGNLGSGIITNNGSLVFNRSDTNLTLNNVITGSGGIVNNGSGEVTLGGANTFSGEVDVPQGTLHVTSSSALGNNSGQTVISSGATLDVANAANISTEVISVSGTGIGGNGAIVNNSGSATFVGQNIGNIYMSGNLTIGGSGRLDFRASSATAQNAILYSYGSPYALTKAGTNLLQMAGVQIDPGLGDINVQNGTLGLQWQIPYLGDSGHNLSVGGNASLAFFDMSNSVGKVLILTNGASVLGQHGTNNVFTGPVTLLGTNTFNVSAAASLIFNNQFGGPGSLVCIGGGTLILSTGPLAYTGNTYVSSSTLALTDVAALTNSPSIVLSNATLDVSARTDGTLALGSTINQTLAGGGGINGILVENSGSIVNPGNSAAPATLTVSNAVTLNGSVIMDLNRSATTVTNDRIVAPSITVSGTLTVTNLGPNLVNGDTFQLFSVPVSGFTSISLPTNNPSGTAAYSWQNNLASAGSITVSVTSLVNTNAATANFKAIASNGALNFSWAPDHLGWQLYTNSAGLTATSNWFPVVGSAAVTNETININPSIAKMFFQLRYP
jgi:fibronectin-binding autotransporter adhesin